MLPNSFTPEFLRQIELLRLRARRAYLGSKQGGHLSLKRGHGIEFFDYRQYELGDNPRHIDWGVYARSERLYVKRFQEEQDLSVLIVVDGSPSMRVEESKWNKTKEIALALGYVVLMQQDTLTVSVLGVGRSPVFYGGRAVHQLGKFLNSIPPTTESNFSKEMLAASSRIRFPGVGIVISDFFTPLEDLVDGWNSLRARNLDLSAIQILGSQDENPLQGKSEVTAVDSETNEEIQISMDEESRSEYENYLLQHQDEIAKFFMQNRIRFTTNYSDQTLEDFMILDLPKTGLLR